MTQDGTKTCPKCGEKQTLDAFSNCSRNKDGKQSKCKSCARRYRLANIEALTKTERDYYKANKTLVLERQRVYYQSNRERILEYRRNYYQINKDRELDRNREYNQDNKEILAANRRKRYASDPVFALSVNCRSRIQKALKGFSKESTTAEILGCTWEHLMHHLESQFKDGMSWDNQGEWHVDHVIPLASENTKGGKIALCHYTNLQPLWAHENLSKGARLDWAAEGVRE